MALARCGFVREHEVFFLAAVRRILELTLKATRSVFAKSVALSVSSRIRLICVRLVRASSKSLSQRAYSRPGRPLGAQTALNGLDLRVHEGAAA